MWNHLLSVVLYFVLILCKVNSNEDFHSSITSLEKIFQTETVLLENLENYIVKSEETIGSLKRHLLKMKQDTEMFANKVSEPIGIFTGVHKSILGKADIENMLEETTAINIAENITRITQTLPYPTDKDLVGAALGLQRLQDFYEMKVVDLANGRIQNKTYNLTLSASDCYYIGYHLYYQKIYKDSKLWFLEALQRLPYEKSVFKLSIPKIWIIESLAFVTYYIDENNKDAVEEALGYAKVALELDPTNKAKKTHVENIESQLKELQLQAEKLQAAKLQANTKQVLEKPHQELNLTQWECESELVRMSCRGDLKKSPTESRNLFCKYERDNHPFLKLAPFKLEISNWDPYIANFYDVLSDNEIRDLQNLSRDQLVRATVLNSQTSIPEPSHHRTSKFAILTNQSEPVLVRLNQRIEDMTGLTMQTAELLQVINYGIGGHYDVHSDSFPEPDGDTILPYVDFESGNRISTVLFYLSDVELGGGTSYPWTKTLVTPQKGKAAFWMNSYLSGSENAKSRHAACPVIVGSKWVANKWIRSSAQKFLKRCKKYDDKKEFDYVEQFRKIKKNLPLNS